MTTIKKQILLFAALFALASSLSAQKFFTRDGKVKFDATAESSPEQIEALSNTGTCVLDAATGKMQWAVLIKNFQFEKALMQEHFNENYMESGKYPKATFDGKISNPDAVDLTKDGKYNASVTGKLTIHGVAKEVTAWGVITVEKGAFRINAGFPVLLADYKISIPGLVADKVGKEAKVLIDATLAPMSK
ncbi:MAG: YceI family protein [Saprospiraceae bacterium]|nr:YceI family protein [Saprospiraceae bacterium]MCB9343095.1 YceI family protein [Lewinellaceae bacterium]